MSRREWLGLVAVGALALAIPSAADEAPITGSVKAVDTRRPSFTIESAAKGAMRTVVIEVRPETKIVRFTRGSDGKFAEQSAALGELKTGWMVSVKTRHEGDREVAELVRVVHER